MTDFAEDQSRSIEPPARGQAAPYDESPTVALLDRWRKARGRNGRIPRQSGPQFPRGDDGGFAERFLQSRRNGRDT